MNVDILWLYVIVKAINYEQHIDCLFASASFQTLTSTELVVILLYVIKSAISDL